MPRAEIAAATAPAKPLELIAVLQSPLLWQERIKERLQLQDVARQILCQGTTKEGKMPFARLYGCCRSPQGTADGGVMHVRGYYVASTGRSYQTGLQHCENHAADPVCSGVFYDLAKVEIAAALKKHRGEGKTALRLDLTASHHHMPLEEMKKRFRAAAVDLYAGKAFQGFKKRFGFIGATTGVEDTYSDANGWHYHQHLVWFCDHLTPADLVEVRRYVDRHWRAALRRNGLDGSKKRATKVQDSSFTADDYVAKFEHARRWDADAELTMNQRKHGKLRGLSPWDLLRIVAGTLENAPLSAERAAALFSEHAYAMRGAHMLFWSKGLREHFALPAAAADDEPVDDDPEEHESQDETEGQADGVLIVDLAPEAWRVVVGNAARAELSIVESSGDPAQVKAFLEALGVRCMLRGAVVMADGP